MPDIRFGIDATSARSGAAELIRLLREVQSTATAAQQAVQAASSGGAGASSNTAAISAATRAIEAQTSALRQLSAAQTASAQSTNNLAAAMQRVAQISTTQTQVAAVQTANALAAAMQRVAQASAAQAQAQTAAIATSNNLAAAMQRASQAAVVQAQAVQRTNVAHAASISTANQLNRTFSSLASTLSVISPQFTQLTIAAQQVGQAFTHLSGISLPFLAGAAAFLGVGAALAAIAVRGIEASDALEKVRAAIAASGGASALTAKQVEEMATRLSLTTTATKDSILDATRAIIQFSTTNKDTLERIVIAAQAAAIRGHNTLEANVTIISRILEGTTRLGQGLRSLGITLTDAQSKQIAALGASGSAVEKLTLVLDILNAKQGEGAENVATFAGQWQIFKNALSDWADEAAVVLGSTNALITAMHGLADATIRGFKAFKEWADGAPLVDQLTENLRKQQEARAQIADPSKIPLPSLTNPESFVPPWLRLEKLQLEEVEINKKIAAASKETQDQRDREANAAVVATQRQISAEENYFNTFKTGHDALFKAESIFNAQRRNAAKEFAAGGITEQQYLERLKYIHHWTIEVADGTNRMAKALAAKEIRDAAAYAKELGEQYDKEASTLIELGLASDERTRALNEQAKIMKAHAQAVSEGRIAIENWNIAAAEAAEREKIWQEQIQKGIDPNGPFALSVQQIEARVAAAGRLAQQQNVEQRQASAAKDTEKIWDNTIQNIQSQWGQLFTNIIDQGSATFKDLATSVKSIFTSLIGNLFTATFQPFFTKLKQDLQDFMSGTTSQALGSFGAGGLVFSKVTGNTPLAPNTAGQSANLFNTIRDAVTAGQTKLTNALSGVFGQTVGGAIGGNAVLGLGSALLGGLTGLLSQGSTAEKIGKGIGTAIGTFAGFKLGSVAGGIGGAAGGAIGGAVGGFALGDIGKQIGVLTSGAGGHAVAKAGLNIASDVLFTAAAGIAVSVPVIGWILGIVLAIIGGILKLVSLFIADAQKKFALTTAPTVAGLESLNQGKQIVREGPFGFVGVAGQTSSVFSKATFEKQILNTVIQFDTAIADHLTDTQIELVKTSEAIRHASGSTKKGNAPAKAIQDRARDILTALGIPEETINSLGLNFAKDFAAGTKAVQDIIDQQTAIQGFVDDLRGTKKEATDASKALLDIRNAMNAVRAGAPAVGIVLSDVELNQLQAQAIARFREGFVKSINDQILQLTDNAALLIRTEQEAGAARIKEAQDAGAGLVEVERLNGLKLADVLKQINQPISDLITSITTSPAGSSPVAALRAAESRFFTLAGTPGASRTEIAQSAQTFLGLGQDFLGSPTFSAKRDLVLSTLQGLLISLPSTAQDTGEQLQDLNMETARGNLEQAQLLSHLIDVTQAQADQIVNLNSKLERLLAGQ